MWISAWILLALALSPIESRTTRTRTRNYPTSSYNTPKNGAFHTTRTYNNDGMTPIVLSAMILNTTSLSSNFPSNCDINSLTLTLSNGSVYRNITYIGDILELDPEGKNLTAKSTIHMECYRRDRNMAAILAFSIIMGLFVIAICVCILCVCVSNHWEIHKDKKRVKAENEKKQKKEELYQNKVEVSNPDTAEKKVAPQKEHERNHAISIQELQRIHKTKNWERYINAGSYMRRVAQILELKTIPSDIWDWVKFDDPEFYDHLRNHPKPICNILRYLVEREAIHCNTSFHKIYTEKYIPMMQDLSRNVPLDTELTCESTPLI